MRTVVKGVGLALGAAAVALALVTLWLWGGLNRAELPDDVGQSVSNAPGP